MAAVKPLPDMDLYGLLGLRPEAGSKEIKKAYRQKALTCHPDKHPDNPRAAELFHQLSQALAVLTDAAARAAYDQLRRAREAAARRTQRLDDKRKRVKLDLEAREAQSRGGAEEEHEEAQSARALEEQVLRLREEGSRQLEEQQRLMREQLLRERRAEGPGAGAEPQEGAQEPAGAKLKLKWKCSKHDPAQGGYSQPQLLALLGKYGEVRALLLSSRKRGRAVAEFVEAKAAQLALRNECGLVSNPLKLSWLEGEPPAAPVPPSHAEAPRPGSVRSERDYESLVMMRMRQAAERQALIDRLKEEDEEDDQT